MSNPVIENIRKSLGRSGDWLVSQRPAIYPAYPSRATQDEMAAFLGEVRKLSGAAQQITLKELAEALKRLVAENGIRKATVWNTPDLQPLGLDSILDELGVELVAPNADKHEMALCDLGITSADYLLPETGTLVLRSSGEKPRAVSLLPRIHLAIVRPAMLRADMHQVFAEAKDSHYLVFITGPSRTADIELTVTLGVHGPKNLFVWMMPDTDM